MTSPVKYEISPVAVVESPFKEKFGIPRQPGLVRAAEGYLRLLPPFDDPRSVDGLAEFSHLWVTFIFHACVDQGWKAKVRPPRLGGNKEIGVFASRAPFRPNHLGLSVLEILAIEVGEEVRIKVTGLDLLDGTPIVDIKPYVSYSDALPDAQSGFAPVAPESQFEVEFTLEAAEQLKGVAPNVKELIEQVLGLDPRPAYKKKAASDRVYGMRLADVDVRWCVKGLVAQVIDIVPADLSAEG